MKLKIKHFFTLEHEENGNEIEIKGYVRELTKVERKELKSMFKEEESKEKKLQELSRINKKLNIDLKKAEEDMDYAVAKDVNDKLEKLNSDFETIKAELDNADILEKALKARFEKTVISDDKDKLRELAEAYGYELILQTINEDIQAKKGNDKEN